MHTVQIASPSFSNNSRIQACLRELQADLASCDDEVAVRVKREINVGLRFLHVSMSVSVFVPFCSILSHCQRIMIDAAPLSPAPQWLLLLSEWNNLKLQVQSLLKNNTSVSAISLPQTSAFLNPELVTRSRTVLNQFANSPDAEVRDQLQTRPVQTLSLPHRVFVPACYFVFLFRHCMMGHARLQRMSPKTRKCKLCCQKSSKTSSTKLLVGPKKGGQERNEE